MPENNSDDWQKIRVEWQQVIAYFKTFFTNPIKAIRFLPDWSWKTLIVLHVVIGAVCGSLSGLVGGHISSALIGLIFMPITYFLAISIFSGSFYYMFLFGFGREINFLKIFTLLTLSGIFFMLSLILKPILSPLILVGLAISALVSIVGFVDYFALPKKMMVRIISTIYVVFVAMWVFGTIQTANKEIKSTIRATPESLDILEKEMKEK